MTNAEALIDVENIWRELSPEMSSEETCAALAEICELLKWLIEKLPEEE